MCQSHQSHQDQEKRGSASAAEHGSADEAHEEDLGGQRGAQLQGQSGPEHLAARHHPEPRDGADPEHLLAELEQMVHLEKKTKQTPVNPDVPLVPFVKAVDASGGGQAGGRPQGGWKPGGAHGTAGSEQGRRTA